MSAYNATSTTQGRTVVGLFHDRSDAEAAINDLKGAGFTNEQIGVAMRDRGEQKDLAESTGTNAASGAATGAVSGGLVGGLIGLLGSLLIPGVGPIVVGGVLASTLVGAGAGAATGGIIGALVGMGVPEEDAQHFDTHFREGGILVTVNPGERTTLAEDILRQHDADLGPSRTMAANAGDATTGRAAMAGDRTARNDEDRRMELREEELDVRKREVEAGEVRIRKEVVSEQRSIDVPVNREELVIERHPATGDRDASGTIGQGEEIRVPLREEEVDVQKRAKVREEVSIGKRQVQDTEHVSDTVRREELQVGSDGDVNLRTSGTPRRGAFTGKDRRRSQDRSYAGPERRTASV
jgi:uncharacterized protein (TIGR02271 family)